MVEYTSTAWLVPMLVLSVLPYLGIAYWVYRDATRRGIDRADAWGVGMLLMGPANPFGLAYYLLARPRADETTEPPTRLDRLVRNVVIASLLTVAVGAVVAPPDPYTQLYAASIALPVVVVLAVGFTYRDVLASVP